MLPVVPNGNASPIEWMVSYRCGGLIIAESWPVDAENNPYHPECLTCHICAASLGGQQYTKHDG